MIRKFLNISLAFLLLLSTSGVVVYKHYCGDIFVKHSIIVMPDNCCGKTCKHCHNESALVKVDDDFVRNVSQELNVKNIYNYILFSLVPTAFNLNYNSYNFSNILTKLLPHYARNIPAGDAVVLFGVFRL